MTTTRCSRLRLLSCPPILMSWGPASDGAALVSEAYRLLPDVIVANISMPILNEIDAVHKLRESGSTAKFVFVTVHSEGEFVEACMAAAVALGYVQKFVPESRFGACYKSGARRQVLRCAIRLSSVSQTCWIGSWSSVEIVSPTLSRI